MFKKVKYKKEITTLKQETYTIYFASGDACDVVIEPILLIHSYQSCDSEYIYKETAGDRIKDFIRSNKVYKGINFARVERYEKTDEKDLIFKHLRVEIGSEVKYYNFEDLPIHKERD